MLAALSIQELQAFNQCVCAADKPAFGTPSQALKRVYSGWQYSIQYAVAAVVLRDVQQAVHESLVENRWKIP